jgi:hypothetical protein
MKKHTLDWKVAAFVIAVGGLKLLGLVFGAVKPHLGEAAAAGLGLNVAAVMAGAPFPEIRRCGNFGDGGGRAGDSAGQHMPRIRLSSERRDSDSPRSAVQFTSSSR